MGFKERYERGKTRLLADESICQANRELFKEFFAFEEYKLKRQNQLRELDEATYKTLYGYILRFRNVNAWFRNKPWKDLTRDDIKQVYDDLEDGKIRNNRGLPFEDQKSYYNKIFKSKPFRLAGQSEVARDVIEYVSDRPKDVHYVTEATFRKMVSVLSKPHHLLLFWLAWDVGENIGAILQLTRRDFTRQDNKYTHEPEYLVRLPRRKLKRSRRERTEPTLYPETVRFADMVLPALGPDERPFPFGHRQALKLMHGVVRRTAATCLPTDDPVTWKDLRSGMACHLIKSGWTREEVDARLGHSPHSKALDAYINYLAIDRDKPKQKLYESQLEAREQELREARMKVKASDQRLRRNAESIEVLRAQLEQHKAEIQELRVLVEKVRHAVSSFLPQYLAAPQESFS